MRGDQRRVAQTISGRTSAYWEGRFGPVLMGRGQFTAGLRGPPPAGETRLQRERRAAVTPGQPAAGADGNQQQTMCIAIFNTALMTLL